MNTRFINARILTMEENCEVFTGELTVKDNIIEYVGKERSEDELKKDGTVYDRTVDVKGNLLMPGFKDAHTHSAMTAFRSLADDLPLQEWLETKIFPVEAKLTGEMVYEFDRLAILEYLTSGITSIFDMYMFPDDNAKACNDMGMRLVQVDDINKFGPSFEVFKERYERLNSNYPLTKYVIGFHAEYTCTRELLEMVCEQAYKYHSPVYAHISETKREVDECIERYSDNPYETIFELENAYHNKGVALHALEEDDDALEAFSLALGINPNYHYTYYEIGIIQETREKYESALKNYEKFLEFDNTDSEVVEAKERVEKLI